MSTKIEIALNCRISQEAEDILVALVGSSPLITSKKQAVELAIKAFKMTHKEQLKALGLD